MYVLVLYISNNMFIAISSSLSSIDVTTRPRQRNATASHRIVGDTKEGREKPFPMNATGEHDQSYATPLRYTASKTLEQTNK